jgi:hypothetical protein
MNGTTVSHYHILEHLGGGGMGALRLRAAPPLRCNGRVGDLRLSVCICGQFARIRVHLRDLRFGILIR